MRGPCNWEVPDCTCGSCLEKANPTVREAALDYATTILWAATGRRFGLCELTVRPCGRSHGSMPDWGWGAFWNGGLWMPYIGADGLWRNCGCTGFCNCRPKCEAYLLGPVDSIVEVVVDGEIVDPATYEVQDGHWLVRVGEGCWPACPDMETAGGFEVTYLQGEPVPAVLGVAARTLACEFVKGCTGGECRLPGRLQFIARQGITAQLVDVERLLDRNMTGVFEVDQVITALNPGAFHTRPRVFSPDRPRPRTVTYPTGS